MITLELVRFYCLASGVFWLAMKVAHAIREAKLVRDTLALSPRSSRLVRRLAIRIGIRVAVRAILNPVNGMLLGTAAGLWILVRG